MRPIDADEYERELLCDMALHEEQLSGDAAYNRALVILTQMPTLTPQNEPLTLDELREMDGEPLGEVEKIIHAHWENTGGNEKVGLAYGTCSHCHREAWANYELTPRCPYCGAHMDGVKS